MLVNFVYLAGGNFDNFVTFDNKDFRFHLVGNCDKDSCVITLDARVDDMPKEVYTWETGWCVGNKASYILEALKGPVTIDGMDHEDMIFEYKGAADLVDLMKKVIELAVVATGIQDPEYRQDVIETNHSI